MASPNSGPQWRLLYIFFEQSPHNTNPRRRQVSPRAFEKLNRWREVLILSNDVDASIVAFASAEERDFCGSDRRLSANYSASGP